MTGDWYRELCGTAMPASAGSESSQQSQNLCRAQTSNHTPGSPLQPQVTQSNQSKSPNHPPLTTSTWEGITHLYAGQPQALVAGGPQAL